jgi:hypothetical protein
MMEDFMSEQTIEIKSITEAQDFHAMKNYYMYKRLPQRTKILAYIFLASLLLLVISESEFGFPFFKPIGIAGIIVVAVIYSWISIDVKPLDTHLRKIVNKKQTLNIHEAGFSVKWEGFEEADYVWSDIEFAYENDFHFFIFIEKHFGFIIPKLLLKGNHAKNIHDLLGKNVRLVNETTWWKYQKI